MFRNFLNTNDPFMFLESFDTKFDIIKVEKHKDIKLYYFDIESKSYRIFVENIDGNLHIGFERFKKLSNKWDINGLTGDLNAKDVLSLFGTLKHILLGMTFYSVNVATKEIKKYGLYRRMLIKLTNELNSEGFNFEFADNGEFLFLYDIEKGYSPKKFKYKK